MARTDGEKLTVSSRRNMTKRQITLNEQVWRMEEVESIAKGYIMAEIDPPFCEVKHINSEIGNGVFATQDLSEGDFVLEYHGELISFKEAKVRNEKYEKDKEGSFIVYFQDKGKRLCVDATHSRKLGRFVNDGWTKNEKNCFLRIVQCENKSYICLFANRDIKKGEEFRFDYGVPSLPWRKKRKRNVCGTCPACVRIDDCSKCRTCKNKKKFGGPGTLKQRCLLRVCHEIMPRLSQASPSQDLRPSRVMSTEKVPTAAKKKDEKALTPSSQPVAKSDRTDHEHDDFLSQERKTGSQDNKKRKNRPMSFPRVKLRRPKTSKKCLKYSALTSSKTRRVSSRIQSTISSNDLGKSTMIRKNSGSTVFDFNSTDDIIPLESVSQNLRKQTHREDHTSAQGQSSRKDKEHTSTAGQNSCNDKEHTPRPTQYRRKDKEHTSAPGQNSCKDKDTAWFEGTELAEEACQNTEEENQNISSQNDMSYLTQRKYSDTSRRSQLDGIIAKLRSKSESYIVELCCDDAFLKDKNLSKKRRCRSDVFEKEDVDSGGLLPKRKSSEVQENSPIMEKENVSTGGRLSNRKSPEVQENTIMEKENVCSGGWSSKRKRSEVQETHPIMESENVTCGGRLSKRKFSKEQEIKKQPKLKGSNSETISPEADDASAQDRVTTSASLDLSVIPHVPVEQCMFPFFEDRTQDAFEETTIIEPDTENPKGTATHSSDTTRNSLVQSYQQCLSDMVEFLEKRAAHQEPVGPSSRRKLVKRLTRKKARIEDLLSEVSEKNEKKDTSGPSTFPRRRKLEGQGASRMLQRLYKTLRIQTAECVQERLDETSFELQVTFKQDQEVNQGEEQMDVPDEDLECGKSSDDKPETWKDISVLVKYTAETHRDKEEEEDSKVREQISSMVHFLDSRISQLQGEASDVHRILKKTIKKIKKKMLIL